MNKATQEKLLQLVETAARELKTVRCSLVEAQRLQKLSSKLNKAAKKVRSME